MKKFLTVLMAAVLSLSLAACQTKEQGGTLIGGALGGALGAQVGQGSGRTAAIIAGTILGAYVGKEMGRYMDASDERKASEALEYNRDNQRSSWHNPNTGADISTTPTRTYVSNGQNCREYQTTILVDGRKERAYGTACRQPDGSWRVMN